MVYSPCRNERLSCEGGKAMSAKRRDKKNRILRSGESQTQDGRYKYTFYEGGKQRAFYSWKLEPTDRLPAGKRDCVALRDQIADYKRQHDRGVAFRGDDYTVYELTRRYVDLKQNVKHTTRAGYKTVLKILYQDPFGTKRIDKVRTMDAKAWLVKLQQEEHRGYSSIQTIRGVLRPAFAMAVEDDLLVKNPFDFMLCDVIVNDSVRREAITAAQMREFLRFVREDRHFSRYYDGIYILFHTGMRISEFCGLTIQDIDLDRRTINIDHQLQRTSDMQYIIVDSAKTDAGTRILPMEEDVYECFSRILAERKKSKVEPMVDGRIGFLYMDKNGMPMVAMHWEKYFQHITEKYNKIYRVQMPKVTPHVCRHTYCSEKAKKGMNPNTLKYLMGHTDISVTLNTYTHLGLIDAEQELERMQREVKMSEKIERRKQRRKSSGE